MLSRKCFKEHIHELQGNAKITDRLYKESNGGIRLYDISDLESSVVSLLQHATRDKSDWIPYWIYELNYGADYRQGCVTLDNVDVPLETVDELYDCLEENYDDNVDYDAEQG